MEHNNDSDIKFPLVKPLPHHLFDKDAFKIYRRLRRFDHEAYFVGGCVRDLLLGGAPKDFDLVTSALPKEVRKIFRNSRIIGRRFLLVNVFFGDKSIEVSTFRRTPWQDGDPPDSQDELLIRHDNFFGTDSEDALRRDFTVNALFYSPSERVVIDYVDGLKDLERGKIRTIGDPDIKFGEDPVRMIRAVKFAARLNFDIVSDVYEAIKECHEQLALSPKPRILLEMQKILRSTQAYKSFDYLFDTGMLRIISPSLAKIWQDPDSEAYRTLRKYLHALENFSSEERKKISDTALTTILALPILIRNSPSKDCNFPLSKEYFERSLEQFANDLNLSKKMLERIRHIIALQLKLDAMNKGSLRYLTHFPEALDILQLRIVAGAAPAHSHRYWQKLLVKQPERERQKRPSRKKS